MAGPELDIDGFLAKLVATRQEMERWIEIKKKQLQTQKRAFSVDMQQKEKDQREAQMYQTQLDHQQECTIKRMSTRECPKEVNTYHSDVECTEKENVLRENQFEIELLQSEKAKKEPVLRQLFEYNQLENEKLQALLNGTIVLIVFFLSKGFPSTDATVQKQKQQQQLEELERGLRMYQRLGLFFDHDGGTRFSS